MKSTETFVNNYVRRTWSQCNPKRTTPNIAFAQLI